jgi:DNA-binding MarR family transcriptional regulator
MVDIIKYLIEHPEKKWVTIKDLQIHFGVRQQNLCRQVKKLSQYGFLEIQVDGQKFLIRRKEDGSIEKR